MQLFRWETKLLPPYFPARAALSCLLLIFISIYCGGCAKRPSESDSAIAPAAVGQSNSQAGPQNVGSPVVIKPSPKPFQLGDDVGPSDVAGVATSGLYMNETDPSGQPFRWTTGKVTFTFPPMPRARKLSLEVWALRPVTLELDVAQRRIIRRTIAPGKFTTAASISSEIARRPLVVQITSTTWRPVPGPNGYTRDIGVELRHLILQ